MEDLVKLTTEVDQSFDKLKQEISESFDLLDTDPERKKEVIGLWKQHIQQFLAFTFDTGEKRGNKDVFKGITKAVIFGR
jgi:hypothetical protein